MARLREPHRSVFGDVEMIFQTHTELAVDADHRLVRETHAGCQRRTVFLHEVCPLVHIKSDTVARSVR